MKPVLSSLIEKPKSLGSVSNQVTAIIPPGEYSDLIHARIIQESLKKGDRLFGEIFKSRCSADGKIGDFQVPYFQQLARSFTDVIPFGFI